LRSHRDRQQFVSDRENAPVTYEQRWLDGFVKGWRTYALVGDGADGGLYGMGMNGDRNME